MMSQAMLCAHDPEPVLASCTESSARHDLAALSEGSLSPEGSHRLAHPLARCPTCALLFTSLLSAVAPVETAVGERAADDGE